MQCGISRWRKITLQEKQSKHSVIPLPTMGDIFNVKKVSFTAQTILAIIASNYQIYQRDI